MNTRLHDAPPGDVLQAERSENHGAADEAAAVPVASQGTLLQAAAATVQLPTGRCLGPFTLDLQAGERVAEIG